MVEWTEQGSAIITSIYSHVDYDDIGPKALSRYFSYCKVNVKQNPGHILLHTDPVSSSPAGV